ncbi:outer membrane protein assembly factor BamE [Thiomicrospira microaerophila]|uniref:outer membrane protein assembly factor BamE n=1 Tax=Thiomicrospira microaerophila TaxID=406020 RepID=UPI0005C9638A|nr:outer membrane protein assembly factor BamE [Thiomicrospira microaerophila]
MKTQILKSAALLLTLGLLQACGGITPYKAPMMQGTVITEEMLADLQPGLHQSQVRQLLGPNYGANPFNPQHWEFIYTSARTDLHQDAVKHILVKFDQDGYLTEWLRLK